MGAQAGLLSLFRAACSFAAALLFAVCMAGCGSPGSPQPPSLKLPVAPADLSVNRVGDAVFLHWTMPSRATDRVPLSGDQRVVICRNPGEAVVQSCQQVGSLLLQPALAGSYTDPLPPELRDGPLRLLTYTVLLQNHARRSAGQSNQAYTAAGTAPPPVEGLTAETASAGIVLRWQPVSPGAASVSLAETTALLRLDRTRILAPGESASGSSETRPGVPQPTEQVLELPDAASSSKQPGGSWQRDRAVDQDARLNRTYRYTVARVLTLTLDGHAMEVSGLPSRPATLLARDLFPPAVPQGLEAVADSEMGGQEAGSIDLSWNADTEPDLAGYYVYRRTAGTDGTPQRVSGATALPDPAWRDRAARPGVRYAYSISAVDADGNESPRSGEIESLLDEVPSAQRPAPATPRHARQ